MSPMEAADRLEALIKGRELTDRVRADPTVLDRIAAHDCGTSEVALAAIYALDAAFNSLDTAQEALRLATKMGDEMRAEIAQAKFEKADAEVRLTESRGLVEGLKEEIAQHEANAEGLKRTIAESSMLVAGYYEEGLTLPDAIKLAIDALPDIDPEDCAAWVEYDDTDNAKYDDYAEPIQRIEAALRAHAGLAASKG